MRPGVAGEVRIQGFTLTIRLVGEPLHHVSGVVSERHHVEQRVLQGVQPLTAGVSEHQVVDVLQAPHVLAIRCCTGIEPLFQHLPLVTVVIMPHRAAAGFDGPSIHAIVGVREGRCAVVGRGQPVPRVVGSVKGRSEAPWAGHHRHVAVIVVSRFSPYVAGRLADVSDLVDRVVRAGLS